MNVSPHILVVDDEPDIALLVRDILEDEGFTVSVARDATEAREARRARRPNLVLLDIWLPGHRRHLSARRVGSPAPTSTPR